jgi:hypothetical protein
LDCPPLGLTPDLQPICRENCPFLQSEAVFTLVSTLTHPANDDIEERLARRQRSSSAALLKQLEIQTMPNLSATTSFLGVVLAAAVALAGFVTLAQAQPRPSKAIPPGLDQPWTIDTQPAAAPGPLDNPLKGWVAYSADWAQYNMPVTMIHQYQTWRALEPVEGQYRWSEWEQSWDNANGTGKHVVMRVYLDYPSLPIGTPQWTIDRGVAMRPYTDHGGGLSPDYNDERLLAAMERFIAALGARYDTNPRIAFVQAGFLGFWGEWHCWPRTPELYASPATEARVLTALRNAFPNKQVVARRGNVPDGGGNWLGYHDDFFPEDTDCWTTTEPCTPFNSWYFVPLLRSSGKAEAWRTRLIGGEMVPDAAPRLLSDVPFSELTPVPAGTTNWQLTLEMTRRARFSWMGPYAPVLHNPANVGMDPNLYRARCEQLVREMGYEFRLTRIQIGTAQRSRPLRVRLEGVNQGLAPIAYSWPVEVALLSTTAPAQVVQRWTVPVNIRNWMPGDTPGTPGSFTIDHTGPSMTAPAGTYAVAVGIIDPWTQRPRVRFANSLANTDGWVVLGTIQIR